MITLMSDFGQKDAYVGIMKGVIAAIAPDVTTCDLTHDISPQDILAGRFNLMMACRWFPQHTVHLAVVDPGVGSRRRVIALATDIGTFVGPDNGLFGGILESHRLLSAVSLTNPAYWRSPTPSSTFHGRDIFAPVAAHLANGVAIEAVGDRIDPDTLITGALPAFQSYIKQHASNPANISGSNARRILATGCIQHIDHFGNIITNIPANQLPHCPWRLAVLPSGASADETLETTVSYPGVTTYTSVENGTLAALEGSHGWIELACNGGNAAREIPQSIKIGGLVMIITRKNP